MTSVLLAAAAGPQPVFHLAPIIISVVGVLILALLVIGLVRLVRFLASAPKEQKLLRMELGKLAEEVHQIREELKAKE